MHKFEQLLTPQELRKFNVYLSYLKPTLDYVDREYKIVFERRFVTPPSALNYSKKKRQKYDPGRRLYMRNYMRIYRAAKRADAKKRE